MTHPVCRRRFLRNSAAVGFATLIVGPLRGGAAPAAVVELPLVDFHVHLDNSTIDKVLALPHVASVKLGIVEHAGTRENQYPVVLSSDTDLKAHLANLEGRPVYRGVQAEWTDWMGCFSKAVLGQLDYVLTDAMTMPGRKGERVKLWLPEAAEAMGLDQPEHFMDRYVDWHVQTMASEPIDILANTTWLPSALETSWDALWTPARMHKVVAAAIQYGIALEISSSYKLPKLPFLRVAKEAGVKFSFGSNGRYPNMGKLDYSRQMARELGLQPGDLFSPAANGQKAIQRRMP